MPSTAIVRLSNVGNRKKLAAGFVLSLDSEAHFSEVQNADDFRRKSVEESFGKQHYKLVTTARLGGRTRRFIAGPSKAEGGGLIGGVGKWKTD